jgi:hypothetical protein
MVKKEGRDQSNLTTAWLIHKIARWFELMTSRCPILALSKLNQDR